MDGWFFNQFPVKRAIIKNTNYLNIQKNNLNKTQKIYNEYQSVYAGTKNSALDMIILKSIIFYSIPICEEIW